VELKTFIDSLLRVVLIYLFLFLNMSLILAYHRNIFPPYGSKQQLVLFSKKGKSTSVSNYRPISLLNHFSKILEFVIHNRVSHYLKFKISPHQQGFSKTKSTTTNLVTYLDYISPLVGSQRQADAIYFDLRNAFDLVLHSLLLHKLSAFGAFRWLCKLVSQLPIQPEISGPCFGYSFLTLRSSLLCSSGIGPGTPASFSISL
jgi:hypothetical protein